MIKRGLFILVSLVFFAQAHAAELIAPGSQWRYFDSAPELPPTWYLPEFDDSRWPIDRAQFGYGEEDEHTVTHFGPDKDNKYPVQYFRTTFVQHEDSLNSQLILRLLIDDGARVYLNGVNVYQLNLPAVNEPHQLATNSLIEHVWIEVPLAHVTLIQGDNTLAVSVHQLSPTSSDLSFDLALVNVPVVPPTRE
ncbi:beta galactosidase jelly roll domain-containing protein [Shewanella sp.]|uniref:beta galactosidase jelly roll domain-containing protein n=1 Tax=Shewanella sp. TaxID=50422 RepID=UPI0025872686|nr:beta galactosidase jelly roll domain-containing protein [Shewanella sp.]MCJ8301392.1 beta galactosidase jelly roll domain-containing protein [Shewanella sp.]